MQRALHQSSAAAGFPVAEQQTGHLRSPLYEQGQKSPLQVIGRETLVLKDVQRAAFNRNTEKGAPVKKYKICIMNNKINNKVTPVTTASRQ